MANYFPRNLALLREKRNLKQAEVATELHLNRSTYANYESGNTQPDFGLVEQIATFFKVDAGVLLFQDLANVNPIQETGHELKKGSVKPIGKGLGNVIPVNDSLKADKKAVKEASKMPSYGVNTPAIITLDHSGKENIVDVPIKARAGYLTGYGDPRYIAKLDAFSLPGLRDGTYRMFEVDGLSMAPTLMQSDRVICKWVESFDQIRENRVHVVVTRDGIVVKRVLNRIAQRGKIVLKSDTITHRKEYPTYEINPEDVLEIWYSDIKISGDLSEPAEVYHRVADLEADMVEMRSITTSFADELTSIKKKLAKIK